jgi:hypothetical protein
MNKKIIFFVTLITTLFFITSCGDNSVEARIRKVRNKKYRSVVVVNNTETKNIKEVKFFTSDGLIIDSQKRVKKDNVLFANFDSTKEYSDVENFKIVFECKNNVKYEKYFKTEPQGLTVVKVSEEDISSGLTNNRGVLSSTGELLNSVGSYLSNEIDNLSDKIQDSKYNRYSNRNK